MKLKQLKTQELSREELKAINAGVQPDCEPGQKLVNNGMVWVCVPLSSCRWELGSEGEDPAGDNSGNGW